MKRLSIGELPVRLENIKIDFDSNQNNIVISIGRRGNCIKIWTRTKVGWFEFVDSGGRSHTMYGIDDVLDSLELFPPPLVTALADHLGISVKEIIEFIQSFRIADAITSLEDLNGNSLE